MGPMEMKDHILFETVTWYLFIVLQYKNNYLYHNSYKKDLNVHEYFFIY
jgi:hypothetical protein